jgi:DNA-binding transcriptional LysR family regulator
MSRPDLNLLLTLDVLLAEGRVARAAKRLQLSPSAMTRALARLRETTGDPLLVRAGRGVVPTPRALGLRGRVAQLVQDADEVLQPADSSGVTRFLLLGDDHQTAADRDATSARVQRNPKKRSARRVERSPNCA